MKHKVLNDISWKQNEKLEAKMQFMKANENLMQKKNEKKSQFIEEKNAEITVHFPFTHGEAIEKQRKDMAKQQKEELLKNYSKQLKENDL